MNIYKRNLYTTAVCPLAGVIVWIVIMIKSLRYYIPKVLYKIVMHKKMSHPADEIQNTFVTFNETRH